MSQEYPETGKFTIPIANDCHVTIVKGNILDLDGLSIIHSSRSFDTDPIIVREGSVLSQFINKALQSNVDIDTQIESRTKQLGSRAIYQEHLPFRKYVFTPGELCPLKTENKLICLAAFCHTSDPYMNEELSLKEYFDYWEGLWRNLSLLSVQKEIVNVTVPGGNFINVSGAPLYVEQRIGIALITYFRHIQNNTPIKQLNFCLNNTAQINLESWHNAVIPYIYGLANLPLEITPTQIRSFKAPVTTENSDPISILIEDLQNFFCALSSHNGEYVTQFEGSKRVNVLVNIDSGSLSSIVENIKSHPSLSSYFGKPKGNDYDRNSIYEILGILIESTNLFGELNRRSVVIMGLNEASEHLRQIIGDNIDNAINYVGQRLKKFKTDRKSLYTQFIEQIPENMRR